ncbi:MAG: AraC family transcriptional regulator ligand-binding domain-containing protein [Polyangiales bacterium]
MLAPRLNVRDLAVGAEDVDINMVSLVVAKAVASAARELGVPLEVPELEATEQGGLADPAHAISRQAFVALLRTVSQRLRDPAAGVRLASLLTSDHLHFVGPLLMSSVTMQQAFERFLLVRRIVLGGPAWRMDKTEQEIVLGHAVDATSADAQLEAQFTATLAHRLTTEFLGPSYRDKVEVRFAFRAPAHHDLIRAFFPGSVSFDSALNGIALPSAAVARARHGSDAAFADAYERFTRQRFLVAGERSTWANRVRQMLLVADHPARVELDALASSWNMSARSARRRLEDEGITFKDLREAVCMELAANWIVQYGRRSPSIAASLGYREVNSFRRAFKRYFGTTPAQFRDEGNVLRSPTEGT